MKRMLQLTGIIEREEDMYVALCPELGVASQGDTVEEARANLIEALRASLRLPILRRWSGGYLLGEPYPFWIGSPFVAVLCLDHPCPNTYSITRGEEPHERPARALY